MVERNDGEVVDQQSLRPLHVGKQQPDGTSAIDWRASGELWVATPGFLLLGDVAPGEPAIMRTVLREDVLDPPKQLVWDHLKAANRRIAVFAGGREVPLQLAA